MCWSWRCRARRILSIPSRIISSRRSTVSPPLIGTFNSIKDYPNGAPMATPSNPYVTFQFHQGLSSIRNSTVYCTSKKTFNSIKDYLISLSSSRIAKYLFAFNSIKDYHIFYDRSIFYSTEPLSIPSRIIIYI